MEKRGRKTLGNIGNKGKYTMKIRIYALLQYPRQNKNSVLCRLCGTEWNPTSSLGSVALHPTYKKVAKVLLLAIAFLSCWGINHRATAVKTESDRLYSPRLLEGDREFIISQEQSDAAPRCDSESGCYRDPPPDRTIPYIISPSGRRWLLDKQPALRWYPVEGAKEYVVQLAGPNNLKWETSVRGDRWWTAYDGPPLEPGAEYLLKVTARDKTAKETFGILPEQQIDNIQAEISQLREQVPPGEELDLAIAKFLRERGLILDAIATLERQVAMETSNLEVYCTLANIYQEMEHDLLASPLQKKVSDAGGSCSLP